MRNLLRDLGSGPRSTQLTRDRPSVPPAIRAAGAGWGGAPVGPAVKLEWGLRLWGGVPGQRQLPDGVGGAKLRWECSCSKDACPGAVCADGRRRVCSVLPTAAEWAVVGVPVNYTWTRSNEHPSKAGVRRSEGPCNAGFPFSGAACPGPWEGLCSCTLLAWVTSGDP